MPAEPLGRLMTAPAAPSWTPWSWEKDVEVAASHNVPVLISAGPAESQEIACQLSRKSRSPRPWVRIVDCREPEAAGAVQSLGGNDHAGYCPEILLLQEVWALSHDDQRVLEARLERALLHPEPCSQVRILASSSVPLFERVCRQEFHERLYYLLNIIHIELPEEAPYA